MMENIFLQHFFKCIYYGTSSIFIYIKKRFLILKSKIKINKQIRQIKQKISGHYLTFPLYLSNLITSKLLNPPVLIICTSVCTYTILFTHQQSRYNFSKFTQSLFILLLYKEARERKATLQDFRLHQWQPFLDNWQPRLPTLVIRCIIYSYDFLDHEEKNIILSHGYGERIQSINTQMQTMRYVIMYLHTEKLYMHIGLTYNQLYEYTLHIICIVRVMYNHVLELQILVSHLLGISSISTSNAVSDY